MKTLLLLRHAKADSQHPAADDIGRPLAARGREDAPRIGFYLRREGLLPDLVLCSAGLRARQTWDLVAEQLADDIEVRLENTLYLAPATRLLAAIHAVPAAVRRLMLIAHNPGMENLARALCGPGCEASALAALSSDYPSSGLAVFEHERGDWRDVEAAGLQLKRFITPKAGLPQLPGDD